MNPEHLTKNKFVDKLLKIVPSDPILQSQYIYYLTTIIFLGLLGFSISTWVELFTSFSFSTLFRGIFMTAISLLSLFGVKQTRAAYHTTKELYKSMRGGQEEEKPEMKIESLDEMMEEFK